MTQLGFSLNVSRCSGCMACVVACMDQNDLPENGPGFRYVARIETGAYPSAEISFASISCFNCGNAPCVIVCPTGAIMVDEDIFRVDTSLCIGCGQCVDRCRQATLSLGNGEEVFMH